MDQLTKDIWYLMEFLQPHTLAILVNLLKEQLEMKSFISKLSIKKNQKTLNILYRKVILKNQLEIKKTWF